MPMFDYHYASIAFHFFFSPVFDKLDFILSHYVDRVGDSFWTELYFAFNQFERLFEQDFFLWHNSLSDLLSPHKLHLTSVLLNSEISYRLITFFICNWTFFLFLRCFINFISYINDRN